MPVVNNRWGRAVDAIGRSGGHCGGSLMVLLMRRRGAPIAIVGGSG